MGPCGDVRVCYVLLLCVWCFLRLRSRRDVACRLATRGAAWRHVPRNRPRPRPTLTNSAVAPTWKKSEPAREPPPKIEKTGGKHPNFFSPSGLFAGTRADSLRNGGGTGAAPARIACGLRADRRRTAGGPPADRRRTAGGTSAERRRICGAASSGALARALATSAAWAGLCLIHHHLGCS